MSLRLVKRKGSDHWYIRGTVRKQSVFESAGTNDKKAAEAIRIKREARLLEDSVYGKKASLTFFEAAVSYMAAGGSPRFLGEEVRGRWTRLMGYFERAKLQAIGQDDLEAAAQKLYPTASADTRNRQCFTPFIAVWNHAVKNNQADVRSWSRPKKAKGTLVQLRKGRAGTKPVPYQRAAQFVLAMSPAPAMVMTALFYTGMRPIELFSLDSEAVDIEKRWITLTNTKTGEARGVPIHEFLVPMLTGLVGRGGRVFRTPKGVAYPISQFIGGQMKTAIAGARKRSGIMNVSPYTARHTVSTQLVMNGVHSHVKDQILGHAVDDMSRHYTNVPQPHLINAINTLPVVAEWAAAPWRTSPLEWADKYIKGMGARTDLKPVQKQSS
jgi:integrase/recombinase XerD